MMTRREVLKLLQELFRDSDRYSTHGSVKKNHLMGNIKKELEKLDAETRKDAPDQEPDPDFQV